MMVGKVNMAGLCHSKFAVTQVKITLENVKEYTTIHFLPAE